MSRLSPWTAVVIFTLICPFSIAAQEIPKVHMINDVPLFRQDYGECGPTSLSMVMNYYGIKKTKNELKGELKFDLYRGVPPSSMAHFPFDKYGLNDKVIDHGSLEALRSFIAEDTPVIVRQYANERNKKIGLMGHYRVVIGYDDDQRVLFINDPDFPHIYKISYSDFLSYWDMSKHPGTSTVNFMIVVVPGAEKKKNSI